MSTARTIFYSKSSNVNPERCCDTPVYVAFSTLYSVIRRGTGRFDHPSGRQLFQRGARHPRGSSGLQQPQEEHHVHPVPHRAGGKRQTRINFTVVCVRKVGEILLGPITVDRVEYIVLPRHLSGGARGWNMLKHTPSPSPPPPTLGLWAP